MKIHPCRFPGCTGHATRWSRRGYCEVHVSEPRRKTVSRPVRPHESYTRPTPMPPLAYNNYGYAIVKPNPLGLRA